MTKLIDVNNLLPHRHPFVFLDRVIALEPGTSGEAVKTYACQDPVFNGWSGAEPCVPPGIILESMAQLSALIRQSKISGDGSSKPKVGYLVAIHDFNYEHPIAAGTTTHIKATLTHGFGSMVRTRCEVLVDDRVCATGELSFRLLEETESQE